MLGIFSLLELRFWFGSDGISKTKKLTIMVAEQEKELTQLCSRNANIMATIEYLKREPLAVEEQARYELGMVRAGEKYYQVVDIIE